MNKLMVIFHTPPDVVEFERNWSERFVPKSEKMPGLKRVSVTRVYGGPAGEVNYHLIHEFFLKTRRLSVRLWFPPRGRRLGRKCFLLHRITLRYALVSI